MSMCDAENLTVLLKGLIVEDVAASIANFLRNVVIPEEFENNEFVIFKLFIHRIMFELEFVPSDEAAEVNNAIYHDAANRRANDSVMYHSNKYGLHILITYSREGDDRDRFAAVFLTSEPPRRTMVMEMDNQQVACIRGSTKADNGKFDILVANYNVKILKFVQGFTAAFGAISRDPIHQNIGVFPDTEYNIPPYHMTLS